MLAVVGLNAWAGLHFFLAAPTLSRDIEKARSLDAGTPT